jgi:integrase
MQITSEGPTKITKATIDGAWRRRKPDQRLIVRDKDCRGLALVVNATTMRWEFAYRPRGVDEATGKRWPNQTMTLGTPESLSVDAARDEAGRLKGQARAGRDPLAERRAAQVARQAAAAEARAKAAEAAFTFGLLVEGWRDAREGDRRPSYLREAVACLERNLPEWRERSASGIALAEAVRALDRIKREKGVVAANRTLAYARAAFSWAVRRQMVNANPLKGIERPGREAPRERVLSAEEVGAIWQATKALGPVRAGYVRCLMLTLQRREEVVAMRWAELSPDLLTWTLPGERAKNGKAHIVHLSEPVQAILAGLPREGGAEFVFAGGSAAGVIGAFSRMKSEINEAIAKERAPLPDWRFYDFRRAGVTAVAGMGFPPHVADKILNHVTGAIQGVAAVYQRAEFLAERRAALDAWAAHVLAAAKGEAPAGNVVPLHAKAG